MVNITKKIVITSKDQMYKLIESRDELSSSHLFIPFMDSMRSHYYGCRCNEALYNQQSNEQFNNLNNSQVTDFLKSLFGCDEVVFQN